MSSSSTSSVSSLHTLASCTRGPHGRAQLLQANPSSSSVSFLLSSSSISLLPVPSDDLCAQVLLNLVQRGSEAVNDGGWTIMQLATDLILRHTAPLHSPSDVRIPVPILIAGYQLALKWCLEYLTPEFAMREAAMRRQMSEKNSIASSTVEEQQQQGPPPHPVQVISLSNLPVLLTLIKSQLSSKQTLLQLRPDESHHLAVLCLRAFSKGLASSRSVPTSSAASNVRLLELPISPHGVIQSSLFDGIVLDIPLPIHVEISTLVDRRFSSTGDSPNTKSTTVAAGRLLRRYGPLSVLIYDINLTFDMQQHVGRGLPVHQVNIVDEIDAPLEADENRSTSASNSYHSSLHAMMRSLVTCWQTNGVTLVACQKVIHPYLKQICLSSGIIPLERLSIRHIDSMHTVSGGKVLSSVDESLVTNDAIGRIDHLEERVVGKRRFLFITPAPFNSTSSAANSASTSTPLICTLLLCGTTTPQLTETSHLISRILKQLVQLLRAPVVTAGAGVTELACAREIRKRVEERRKENQSTYESIRSQLKADPSSPLISLDASLHQAHLTRQASRDRLLDASCLHVADAFEHLGSLHSNDSLVVLDYLFVKRTVMQTAIEATTLILRTAR